MSATITGYDEFLLDQAMLGRFRERAPVYDRENRFFSEDFEELRGAGYLKIALPEDVGGGGRDLLQYTRELSRLASHAPPTALATNMHVAWTGIATDLNKSGDQSFDWLLKEAASGEVFGNGHGERGNDLNGFISTVEAKRVDGGYSFTGHKIFGSLSPVWTRLAVWGMDTAHADGPQMVHAFIKRDAAGYRIVDTWDTLGMRATKSDDTVLEGVIAPDSHVVRVMPAGSADNFLLAAYTWIEVSFGAVYLGVAGRALTLAVESAKKRTSIGLTRPMAYHPEVQHEVAEMVIAMEAASALVERTARDWVQGVDYGDQAFLKLLATKHVAVEAAQRVVDLALRTSGGTGMFKSSELERLYRDVRCGGFHPANSMLAHEIIAKTALGIDPGEQPRWG